MCSENVFHYFKKFFCDSSVNFSVKICAIRGIFTANQSFDGVKAIKDFYYCMKQLIIYLLTLLRLTLDCLKTKFILFFILNFLAKSFNLSVIKDIINLNIIKA